MNFSFVKYEGSNIALLLNFECLDIKTFMLILSNLINSTSLLYCSVSSYIAKIPKSIFSTFIASIISKEVNSINSIFKFGNLSFNSDKILEIKVKCIPTMIQQQIL